jgi:hypothetical protein
MSLEFQLKYRQSLKTIRHESSALVNVELEGASGALQVELVNLFALGLNSSDAVKPSPVQMHAGL